VQVVRKLLAVSDANEWLISCCVHIDAVFSSLLWILVLVVCIASTRKGSFICVFENGRSIDRENGGRYVLVHGNTRTAGMRIIEDERGAIGIW